MTDFFELLKTRRSIRDFEDRPVDTRVVLDIIRDCTLAPNSGNNQPWQFIVINNRDMIKRLSDNSKAGLLALIEKDPTAYIRKYEETLRMPEFNVFYNAPCLVLMCGPREVLSLQVDCGLAAAYFMLAAAARGLGTTWIGLGREIHDPGLLVEIGLPKDVTIVAPLIVGYPKAIPPVPERRDPLVLKIIQ